MIVPSKQKLIEAFGDEKGAALHLVLKGKVDPLTYKSVVYWDRQCYHKPSHDEMAMLACNEIMEGYGIEALTKEGAVYPCYDYVNLGDPYVTTLVRRLSDNRVTVCCWGDIVEKWPTSDR